MGIRFVISSAHLNTKLSELSSHSWAAEKLFLKISLENNSTFVSFLTNLQAGNTRVTAPGL